MSDLASKPCTPNKITSIEGSQETTKRPATQATVIRAWLFDRSLNLFRAMMYIPILMRTIPAKGMSIWTITPEIAKVVYSE